MLDTIESFLSENAAALGWLVGLTVVLFVGATIFVPVVLVRMRADYFLDESRREGRWRKQYPMLVPVVLILRNILGLLLALAGLVMLLTPGQGLLTLFVGLMVMDFPGKFHLEQRVVSWRPIYRSINWLRAKFHRDALKLKHAEDT